jgi:hypothetical protein
LKTYYVCGDEPGNVGLKPTLLATDHQKLKVKWFNENRKKTAQPTTHLSHECVPTREIAKSLGLQCEALFEAPLRPEDFSARHYFPAYDASVSISCYLGLTFKEILCIFIVSLIFFIGRVLPLGVIYLLSVASGAVGLTPPVARPTRLRTSR